MATVSPYQLWRYVRGLTPPILVLAVLVGWLAYSHFERVHWWREADESNLREWLDETRVFRKTLSELVRDYLKSKDPDKAEEIQVQLEAMCNPTRKYQGQLPLFPVIYRLEIRFQLADGQLDPISWESHLPASRSQKRDQVRTLEHRLLGDADGRAVLIMDYQLHAFSKTQQEEERRRALLLSVGVLATASTVLVAAWGYFHLRRERKREMQGLLARQQIEHAEKLVLENELRRQEAERKQEEMERSLLEQRLATQAAERQALELKSQLYASIGIMAGSYAHNIKNLLVRPNDLLSRCLEGDGLTGDQQHMLGEVRQTLGTVTERLQQILRTVRRDPTRSEMTPLELNAVVRELHHTWEDLAREKWKMNLLLDTADGPLPIEGDLSHLQQAVENLIFNARDATFEMRNHLRDQAHRDESLDPQARRQAVIAAAGWRGAITLRTRRQEDRALLEVEDNGIGMTEEVRRQCTETHFTTKRDNAVYEGNTTGMGLGLSFVVVILEHHKAALEIQSEPLQGALFRVSFPLTRGPE